LVAVSAKQTSDLVDDITAPELVEFVLFDYNTGIAMLSFSEPVLPKSFSAVDMQLHGSFNQELVTDSTANPRNNLAYRLSASVPMSTVGPVTSEMLNVSLSRTDLNAMKQAPQICPFAASCHVRVTTSFVTDAFDVDVLPIAPGNQNLFAQNLLEDEAGPILIDAHLNMQSHQFLLTFDEPVASRSVSAEKVTLQNSKDTGAIGYESFTLGSSPRINTFPDYNEVVGVVINDDDILSLKALLGLAITTDSTYVAVDVGVVSDIRNNDNVALSGLAAFQAGDFTPDTTLPALSSFTSYNPSTGQIELSFSEPINLTSFDALSLSLQSVSDINTVLDSSAHTYTLRQEFSKVEYRNNAKMFAMVTMSEFDLSNVQSMPQLAVDQGSTHISFTSSFVTDTADVGNTIFAAPADAAIQVSSFGEIQLVSITSFRFDLDAGVLYIRFSGVVAHGDLDARFIKLSSDIDNYSLTGYVNTSMTGFEMTIEMTDNDVNNIKAKRQLAFNRSSTNLIVDANALNDLNDGPIVPVADNAPLGAAADTPDTTDPAVE
jgi:hypothetical protein